LGLLMGIRFSCPNGHKLNVKVELAGKRALCPECGAKIQVPEISEPSAVAVAPAAAGAIPAAPAGSEPRPSVIESASPSVVIALAESSVVRSKEADPPQVHAVPPRMPGPMASAPVASAPSISESIVVPRQPPMVKPAPPLPPDIQYQMRRERNRRNQVRIAVVLILMVIGLGIALIWVLWNNASTAPSGHDPSGKTGQNLLLWSIVSAATHESFHAKPRS
jgi:hypothetical protein